MVALCCSAPGKVLITGGYLVLERPNCGIVLTLSARFYATIKPGQETRKIIINSPQFASTFAYKWHNLGHEITLSHDENQPENKYIEQTLLLALVACVGIVGLEKVLSKLDVGLFIEMQGDNDFYSQAQHLQERGLSKCSASLRSLPKFLKVSNSLQNIAKTGLGSSAALVTSLTAAVMVYFEAVDLSTTSGKDMVHNLAQVSHCAAQGKVGSGFDISSAVYGSQIYTRFSPQVLDDVLKKVEEGSTLPVHLLSVIKGAWDNQATSFSLPPGLEIMLGDVNVGSNTPVMVKKVLSCKNGNMEVLPVWNAIANANKQVEIQLESLAQLAERTPLEYHDTLAVCASVGANEWDKLGAVGNGLLQIRKAFLDVRLSLRKLGDMADVPIEPSLQTRLADTTMNIAGVLLAGVPGAGGFDAMFAVTLSPKAIHDVEDLWLSWEEMSVCPLILREDKNGVCVEYI